MSFLIKILSVFLLLAIQQNKDPLFYTKQGKPSTKGIDMYISQNHDNLIAEYEYRIDTLYDVYLFSENLTKENGESGDLGNFYLPDYIIITNEEKYVEYEYKYI